MICRRGNDSQLAVQKLQHYLQTHRPMVGDPTSRNLPNMTTSATQAANNAPSPCNSRLNSSTPADLVHETTASDDQPDATTTASVGQPDKQDYSRTGEDIRIRDIQGGLQAWARDIDSEFPFY